MDKEELYPPGYGQERRAFLAELEGLLERNKPEAALDLARGRLKRIPGDPDARIGLCRALLRQGRTGEAVEMLAEVEEIIAGLSRLYTGLGDLCIRKGMEEAAEVFYRRSMILNPGVNWARDILEQLKGVGEPAEAGAEAGAEEDADVPSDFRTATLAELYVRQGHLRDAEELLERIVGQEPQNAKASELLREVRGRISAEAAERRNAAVISELNRWLDNIDGVRGHAG